MASEVESKGKILYLEVENFKSYGGRHVVGPFRGFQAVIGPNGAGKSNLMDALAFVLGCRNNWLRAENLRDLVHRGETAVDGRRTSVVLVFQKKDGNVVRFGRALRNEPLQSEYSVDGKVMTEREYEERLKEINILVKAKNFLVFQGDIANMAGKSPLELAALFEKLGGGDELVAEYEKALAERTKAEENTMAAFHKKKGLGAEKRQFKAMKEEAEHFENLRKERDALATDLALVQLRHFEKGEEKFGKDIEKETRKIAKLTADIDDKRDEIGTAKEEKMKLLKEKNTLAGQIKSSSVRLDKNKSDAIHTKENLRHAQAAVKKATSALDNIREEVEKKDAAVAELEAEIQRIREEKDAFLDERRAEEERMGALTAEQRAQYNQIEVEALQQAAPLRTDLERLARQKSQSSDSLDMLIRQTSELRTRVERLETQRKLLKERYDRTKEKFDEAVAETERAEKDSAVRQITFDEASKRSEALSRELAGIEGKLSTMRVSRHEEERAERQRSALSALKNAFPGVLGRLQDLCHPISGEYKTAVSVAIGGRFMDAIVVDRPETAKKCVRFMQEQRLGIATFLPLVGLHQKGIRESARSLGHGVHLAIDCISCNEEIRPVVVFAVGNTLITDTIETARDVCFNRGGKTRYRAVSLDGTVIEKSGVMTGGMSEKERRASGWNESERVELKKRKDAILIELEDVNRKLSSLRMTADPRTALAAAKEHRDILQRDLDGYEKALRPLDKELSKAQNDLAALEPKIKLTRGDVEKCEESIADLQKQIDARVADLYDAFGRAVGIPNIREVESNRAKLTEQYNVKMVGFESEISKLDGRLRFEKSRDVSGPLRRAETALKDSKKKLTDLEKKSKAIEKETEQCEKLLSEGKEKEMAIATSIKEKDDTISKGNSEITRMNREVNAAKADVSSLESELSLLLSRKHEVIQKAYVEQTNIPLLNAEEEFLDMFEGMQSLESQPMDVDMEGTGSSSNLGSFTQSQAVMDKEKDLEFDFGVLKRPHVNYRTDTLKQYEDLLKDLAAKIKVLSDQIGSIAPNLKATEQLSEVNEKLEKEKEQFDTARNESHLATERFLQIRKERTARFRRAFDAVNAVIDETYKELTRDEAFPIGGTAFLSLESEEEPYLHGVKYSPIPPKNRFQPLESLSGGEKTMAALALLFAIQRFQPAPFVILDEIDSALDAANSAQVARYLMECSKNVEEGRGTQCIVISLKQNLYERADALIGIAKDQRMNTSRTFTLDLTQYDDN